MKPTHLILSTLIFAVTLATQAKDQPDWFHKASAYCASLSFSNSRLKCQKEISLMRHVDSEALDLCLDLPMNDLKESCLKRIANKIYHEKDLALCRLNTLSSEKLKCLGELGKPFVAKRRSPPGSNRLSKAQRRELERILLMLESGKTQRAQRKLERFLSNS